MPVKLWSYKGRAQNGLPVSLLPIEDTKDGVGMGHHPLLESVGAEVDRQVATLLRDCHPTNNSVAQLQNLLASKTMPTSTTGLLTFEWPVYIRDSQATSMAASQSAAGLFMFKFCCVSSV